MSLEYLVIDDLFNRTIFLVLYFLYLFISIHMYIVQKLILYGVIFQTDLEGLKI